MKKLEIIKQNGVYKAFTKDTVCYFDDFKDLKTRIVDIFIPCALGINLYKFDISEFQDFLKEMFSKAKNVREIQRKINSFYQLCNL